MQEADKRTSTTAATATSASSTSTVPAATTAAAIARHLMKTRIDLLLRLRKYCNKIASLLRVCKPG